MARPRDPVPPPVDVPAVDLVPPVWPGPVPFDALRPSPAPVRWDIKAHPGAPGIGVPPCTQIAVSTPSLTATLFIQEVEAMQLGVGLISTAAANDPALLDAAISALMEKRSGLVLPTGTLR